MPAAPLRPRLGLTTYRQPTRWWSWDRDAALVPGVYLDVVVAAGGWPVLVPPLAATVAPDAATDAALVAEGVAAVLTGLDGLVVIGGGDLDAARYGQVPGPHDGGVDGHRDELDAALLAGALDADLPVLAICRGHQVLNVLCGGDLVQHLPDVVGHTGHQPAAGAFGPVTVETVAGSHVGRLLGATADVLCCHHQAVGRVGAGLVVTARSTDGVVEAVEMPGRTFAVGVPWHPEEHGDVRLFAGLVAAARPAPAPGPSRPRPRLPRPLGPRPSGPRPHAEEPA